MHAKGRIIYILTGPLDGVSAAVEYAPLRGDAAGFLGFAAIGDNGRRLWTPELTNPINISGSQERIPVVASYLHLRGDIEPPPGGVDALYPTPALGNNFDDVEPVAQNRAPMHVMAHLGAFSQMRDGIDVFDRIRLASADVHATATKRGILAATQIGGWTIQANPAVNAQATVTQAAGGAGIRHILTSICATFSAGGTAGAIRKVFVRDGATGVGAILWSANIAVPVGTSRDISLNGLAIVGSVNTAMTVEFDAAGGATTQENISATGYATN